MRPDRGRAFLYMGWIARTAIPWRRAAVSIAEEPGEKTRFLVELMRKYADPNWSRPKAFFPRFDEIDVYAMTIERLTGKPQVLPELAQRWLALDRTKSPNARVPREDSQAT